MEAAAARRAGASRWRFRASAGLAAPRTAPNWVIMSPGAPQVGAFCQGAQVFRVQRGSVIWVVRKYIGRSSGPFKHQTIFQINISYFIRLHTRRPDRPPSFAATMLGKLLAACCGAWAAICCCSCIEDVVKQS